MSEGRAAELKAHSREWVSWDLTSRQLCDFELLLNGAFSPLSTFLGRDDYESVCASMRLSDGTLWPIPVTLDVSEEFASGIGPGTTIALRDPEGVMLAAMHVNEVWRPDRRAEAEALCGTASMDHPAVAKLCARSGSHCVGGRIEGVQLPTHYDFRSLRLGPAELRSEFTRLGWTRILAYQTRSHIHREQFELSLRAAKQAGANLLIHPLVGMSEPGDVDHYTRVRCYQAILRHHPKDTVRLALLPLTTRMGGPRERLWHAIIGKNYGCSHLIVDHDHVDPGANTLGGPVSEPDEVRQLAAEYQAELGIVMLSCDPMVYVPELGRYVTEDAVPRGSRALSISTTELRRRFADGSEIPEWFTFPEVADELRRSHPPRHRSGYTVFFTGLSGAGKSTIANALMVKLLEMGDVQLPSSTVTWSAGTFPRSWGFPRSIATSTFAESASWPRR